MTFGLPRPHRFESPIGLSRTPAESPILGAIWLISRLNALLRPVCVRGRSDSQICEAVGVGARPLTTKSCDLSESPPPTASQIWESEVKWEADRTPTASQIWESDRPLTHTGRSDSGRCSPILGTAWLISRLNALLRPESDRQRSERPCAWEAVLPWLAQTGHMTNCVRPRGWEAESERPWEAVRGRAPLIGSNRSGTLWHRSLSQSWGARPLTAFHFQWK